MAKINKIGHNFSEQVYKGIRFRLLDRNYKDMKARRFLLIPPEDTSANPVRPQTNQNVWIPIKHLGADCILKENEDIDYVFRKAHRQLELAGYIEPIIGIKRRTVYKRYNEPKEDQLDEDEIFDLIHNDDHY